MLKEHMDSLPVIFTAGATGLTALFGGWDKTFQVFIIIMVLDMLTGVFKGLIQSDFSSKRMREGFVTKFGYIIVIVLATQVDTLLPQDMPLLRTVAIWFYIFVEGSSVIENLAQMGVPIPQVIVDRLSVINGKGGERAELGEDGRFITTKEKTTKLVETKEVVVKTENDTQPKS